MSEHAKTISTLKRLRNTCAAHMLLGYSIEGMDAQVAAITESIEALQAWDRLVFRKNVTPYVCIKMYSNGPRWFYEVHSDDNLLERTSGSTVIAAVLAAAGGGE